MHFFFFLNILNILWILWNSNNVKLQINWFYVSKLFFANFMINDYLHFMSFSFGNHQMIDHYWNLFRCSFQQYVNNWTAVDIVSWTDLIICVNVTWTKYSVTVLYSAYRTKQVTQNSGSLMKIVYNLLEISLLHFY